MNYTCTTKVVRQDRQGIFFLNILFLHFYLFFAAILVVIFVLSISRFSTSFQLSKWEKKHLLIHMETWSTALSG